MVYFILLLVAIVLVSLNKRSKQHNPSYIILFIMMSLCALRADTVSVDTSHYIENFNNGELGYRYGILYDLLDKLIRYFDFGSHGFLIIMSIITYIPLFYLFKQIKIPAVGVLLFMTSSSLYLETFNLVRQSAAIVYILLFYFYLENRRYKTAIIPFIIAVLLHKISYLILPFILFHRVQFSRNAVLILVVSSFVFGISSSMSFFSDNLRILSNFLTADGGASLGGMLRYYNESDALIGEWGIIGMLVNGVPLSLLTIVSYNKSMKGNTFYNMMLLGVIVQNVLISSVLCVRIASIFSISQIMAVPQSLLVSNRKESKMIFMCLALIIFLYVYKLWGYYVDPFSLGVIPYKMFFIK